MDRLLIRIGRLDAGRWLALGEHELSTARDIDRLATAELLAGAAIAHRGLAFREWLAADAVDTLACLAVGRAHCRAPDARRLMILARRAARRATTAELARPDLSSGDYELLMAPVRSVLSLCAAHSR